MTQKLLKIILPLTIAYSRLHNNTVTKASILTVE